MESLVLYYRYIYINESKRAYSTDRQDSSIPDAFISTQQTIPLKNGPFFVLKSKYANKIINNNNV